MLVNFKLFIDWAITILSFFLLVPLMYRIIDFVCDSITFIIKNFITILVIIHTSITFFLWLIILRKTINNSINFNFIDDYQYTHENNNITLNSPYDHI